MMIKKEMFEKFGSVFSKNLGIVIPDFPLTPEGDGLFKNYISLPEVQEEIKSVKNEKIKSLLGKSDINNKWYDRNLDTFEERNKVASKMKKFAIDYIAKWQKHFESGLGIYLYGSVGTGKTHLACAIAQEIIAR
ncbi:MAG TPA: hypothetical protein PLN45_06275, partial [Exilispira sp.]|nr:hypothetical protein [Exilispira sp.]